MPRAISASPFVVFSLPRSRSFWLSRFLTYGAWTCSHDMASGGWEEMRALFQQPLIGSCETGAVVGWRRMREIRPEIRFAVARRPVEEVEDSIRRLGMVPNVGELVRLDELIDEVEAIPGTVSVGFDGLHKPEACCRVFEHCLMLPFDLNHWRKLAKQNLQVDMPARIKKLAANKHKIERLFSCELRSELADRA